MCATSHAGDAKLASGTTKKTVRDRDIDPKDLARRHRRYNAAKDSAAYKSIVEIVKLTDTILDRIIDLTCEHRRGCSCAFCSFVAGEDRNGRGRWQSALLALSFNIESSIGMVEGMMPLIEGRDRPDEIIMDAVA